jgi:DNA repair protein RadD
MMQLRWYQEQAVAAVYQHLRLRDDNPCVVIPTAGGKTPVIATLCKDAVGQWNGRVLILAHVKELLQQAADKLQAIAPEIMVGVYSAGLGSRETLAPVIIGGIQSAYKRGHELGHFDLVIIDEAHMIPADGDGMYRTLLTELKSINPMLRIIGLTATPFRLSSGPICGPDNILNTICYEVGVRQLIVQGYLCPLLSKAGKEKADTDKLHVRGGEYVANEVEVLMDDAYLVESACKEIVAQTQTRRSCLIFAAGVKHGKHVAATLKEMGQRVATVFGDTLDFERDQTLSDFKSGAMKFLVNVNVLTTGFDAQNIDCIALMRPTLSPGLFYQMVGRGFRLHPNKQNCLVLDFGGNVLRHGPVDAIRIRAPSSVSEGDAPAKECPQCHSVIAAGYANCPDCGFEFPRAASKHEAHASTCRILSGQITQTTYPVQEVHYYVHEKRNAPPDAPRSMRVEYCIGWQRYQSEWICFEHVGFARQKAEQWWTRRTSEPVPNSADEAVARAESGCLCATKSITVRNAAGQDFERIVGYELDKNAGAKPEPEYIPANDEIPF